MKAFLIETLVWYDGPQLFLLNSAIEKSAPNRFWLGVGFNDQMDFLAKEILPDQVEAIAGNTMTIDHVFKAATPPYMFNLVDATNVKGKDAERVPTCFGFMKPLYVDLLPATTGIDVPMNWPGDMLLCENASGRTVESLALGARAPDSNLGENK